MKFCVGEPGSHGVISSSESVLQLGVSERQPAVPYLTVSSVESNSQPCCALSDVQLLPSACRLEAEVVANTATSVAATLEIIAAVSPWIHASKALFFDEMDKGVFGILRLKMIISWCANWSGLTSNCASANGMARTCVSCSTSSKRATETSLNVTSFHRNATHVKLFAILILLTK